MKRRGASLRLPAVGRGSQIEWLRLRAKALQRAGTEAPPLQTHLTKSNDGLLLKNPGGCDKIILNV